MTGEYNYYPGGRYRIKAFNVQVSSPGTASILAASGSNTWYMNYLVYDVVNKKSAAKLIIRQKKPTGSADATIRARIDCNTLGGVAIFNDPLGPGFPLTKGYGVEMQLVSASANVWVSGHAHQREA